ncbi:glycosyltransferase family 4 protein [Roseivivax sp.]
MSAPTRRPRVLVLAEAANPDWVSVPLVGWSLAHALRDVAEVHLVTQVRNRAAILKAGYVEGRDFTAIDTEALARPAHRAAEILRMGEGKGWTMVQAAQSLTYPWFEHKVWQRFGPALEAGDYDLVHRVTPLAPTAPSPLAARLARIGVPFVLGPLNGGVPWPEGYGHVRRAEREWLGYLRGLYKRMPGRGATLRHASAILAGSRFTAAEIPAAHHHKVLWLPENAVDPARFPRRPARMPGAEPEPLRAVFVGRLVALKGVDMLIEAARGPLSEGRLHLEIIGDGPEMARLTAQAARLGDAVRFAGWLPHAEVQGRLAEADLLAFPSIRDFGGGVVLEAMAMGRAPLVVDYAGPGELVTPETGYKVPILPPERLVPALSEALAEILADPEGCRARGARAAELVASRFTWAAKAEQVARVYDWVLSGRATPAPALLGGPLAA